MNAPPFQFSETEFVWIFVTPLVVLLVKTAFKYVTKIAVLVQDKPDPNARRAAHFDCLRTGLDLAIIGLVATAAAVRLALKTSHEGQIGQLATQGMTFLLVQVALVTFTAVVSAIFYSPDRTFYRGVLLPLPLGCFSIYAAAWIFSLLTLH